MKSRRLWGAPPQGRATPFRWVRWALGWGLAMSLSACGFTLRQPPTVPYTHIELRGLAEDHPLRTALIRSLLPGTQFTTRREEAQIVLDILEARETRTPLVSNAFGQVREMQVSSRLRFQLLSPDGQVLLPPTPLSYSQDISWREDQALAKEWEAQDLHSSLRPDLVFQLRRFLAAAPRPRRLP